MENLVIGYPVDRPVYGITDDGDRVQIGTIACVTPREWVMYWSDAKWRFVSCYEGVPSSKPGTMEACEIFVFGLVNREAA